MTVERHASGALAPATRAALAALLGDAYGEDMTQYLADVGPGEHFTLMRDGRLAVHAMVVPRLLEVPRLPPLRTAYVELVATHPSCRRRGLASSLLRYLVPILDAHDVAALSPVDAGFYARLGWERWRGPRAVRTPDGLAPTPDEEVMIHRLPRTPSDLDLDAPLSVEWRPGEVW